MTQRELIGFGPTSTEPNPCVRLFGYGPEGATCKSCGHLYAHCYRRTYYKCDLRKDTAGPGSDHRVGWRACGKWQEGEGHGLG